MKPSVEAIAEFHQIAGKRLFSDSMVRSMDRIFHVSQDCVYPPEIGVLTAFGSTSPVTWLMNASGPGHSPGGSQSVRDNHRSGEVLPPPRSITGLRKTATRVSRRRWGRSSGVQATAATNGVFPGVPRPRFPPRFSPPQYASSIWTSPSKGRLSSRSFIT